VVPGGHGVKPAHRPRGDFVAGDQLLVAALLHRDGESVHRGERRPAGADRLPPQQPRRLCLPTPTQPNAGQVSVATGAEKLGEILRRCRLQIDVRRFGGGPGQTLVRIGLPTEDEARHQIAAHLFNAQARDRRRQPQHRRAQDAPTATRRVAAEKQEPDENRPGGDAAQHQRGHVHLRSFHAGAELPRAQQP